MSYFYSVDVLGAWVSVEGLMGDRKEVPSFVPFSFIQGDAQLQIRMSINGSGTGWSSKTLRFLELETYIFLLPS